MEREYFPAAPWNSVNNAELNHRQAGMSFWELLKKAGSVNNRKKNMESMQFCIRLTAFFLLYSGFLKTWCAGNFWGQPWRKYQENFRLLAKRAPLSRSHDFEKKKPTTTTKTTCLFCNLPEHCMEPSKLDCEGRAVCSTTYLAWALFRVSMKGFIGGFSGRDEWEVDS